MDQNARSVRPLLDRVQAEILRGEAAGAMNRLCVGLNELRAASRQGEWDDLYKAECRQHPIRDLLHQDPYTRRAFEKPRGYAGDAVMLDYIYLGVAPPETTALGMEVFRSTTGLPNGQSVIARRDTLARLIDEVAGRRRRPKILSIACGHLREAQRSAAVSAGLIGELIALDQDRESLALVAAEQARHGVTVLHCSVKSILAGKTSFSGFDLVYAAGLFDYLSDAVATLLTGRMFDMLAPGGRLLLANFTPENHGRGYMEAFMDWTLVYRDEEGLAALCRDIPPGISSRTRIFRDLCRNLVYLEMKRK